MTTATMNAKSAQSAKIVPPTNDEILAMVPADLKRRIERAVTGLNKATTAHEKAVANLRLSRVFVVRAVEELAKLAQFRKGKNQTLNKGYVAIAMGYTGPVMSKFYRGLDAYSAIPVEERNIKAPTEAEILACNKGFDAEAEKAQERREKSAKQDQGASEGEPVVEPVGGAEVSSDDDVSLAGDLLAQVAQLKKTIANSQSAGMSLQQGEFEVLQAGLLSVLAIAEDMVA